MFLKSDFDKVSFEYFKERVNYGEKIMMRDIYGWCNAHGITYKTKYQYRKDMPLKANIFNLFSYIRAVSDNIRHFSGQNE